jgi:UDP-2,4-diacetamido-2,4,6-trideoxy-beta-L-altropyranose hydrolase
MNVPDFVFRLDADPQIGTGHLMRCLAIADQLAESGASCLFLCHPLPSSLQALLSAHQYQPVNDETQALEYLASWQPRWLVIDHYGLDIRFERAARPHVQHILVIDDLADRSHDADWLLDQGPLRQASEYRPLLNPDCQLLLGADYALLRPAFNRQRKTGSAHFRHGLISFGGADPAHACLTILDTLAATPWLQQCRWTLLAGAANPDWEQLQQWLATHPSPVTLLRHCDDMASLLAGHDFAIGAAGGMMWERCCIGLPTLSVPIVDNQQFNDEVIARFDLGERLTLEQLTDALELDNALLRLQTRAEHYCQQGQQLVDGLGLARLTELLRNQN